jgi:hypothetical protein
MSIGVSNNISKTRFPEYRTLTGRARYCLDFDGNDGGAAAGHDYLATAGTTIMQNTGTMSAIIKTDSLSTHDTILSFARSGLGANNVDGAVFSVGGGNLQFSSTIDNQSSFVGVANSDTVATGTWYQLVGTWTADGSGSLTTEFWINGTKQSGTFSDTNVAFMVDGIKAGLDNTVSGNRRWGGRIYDMAMWRVVLTDDEIANLYNNGRPRSPNCIRRSGGAAIFGGAYVNDDLVYSIRINDDFGYTTASYAGGGNVIPNLGQGKLHDTNLMYWNFCEEADLLTDTMYTV